MSRIDTAGTLADAAIEKGLVLLLIFTALAFGTVQHWSVAVMEILAFTLLFLKLASGYRRIPAASWQADTSGYQRQAGKHGQEGTSGYQQQAGKRIPAATSGEPGRHISKHEKESVIPRLDRGIQIHTEKKEETILDSPVEPENDGQRKDEENNPHTPDVFNGVFEHKSEISRKNLSSSGMQKDTCGRLATGVNAPAFGTPSYLKRGKGELLSSVPAFQLMLFSSFIFLVLFQLLPLPEGLLRVISPHSLSTYKTFGGFPAGSLLPVSVLPYATVQGLLKLLSYAAVFYVVVSHYRTKARVHALVRTIVYLGLFLALFAVIQKAAWNGRIFWFYPVEEYLRSGSGIWGPYVNRNHFAGYMEMVIPLALGLLIYAAPDAGALPGVPFGRRVARFMASDNLVRFSLLFLAVLIMAACLFMTLSRGGIAGFGISFSFFVWITRKRRTLRSRALLLGLLAVVIAIVIVFAAWDRLEDRFEALEKENQISRLIVWKDSLGMIRDYPLFGSGLGTFENTFMRYQSRYPLTLFDHAHNDYVELLTDTGLAGFVLVISLALVFFFTVFRRWLRRRSLFAKCVGAGGLTSCVALAVHSVTDFNLHIPANALLLTVIAGLTYAAVFRVREKQADQRIQADTSGKLASGDTHETVSKDTDVVIARLDRAIQASMKTLDSRLRENDSTGGLTYGPVNNTPAFGTPSYLKRGKGELRSSGLPSLSSPASLFALARLSSPAGFRRVVVFFCYLLLLYIPVSTLIADHHYARVAGVLDDPATEGLDVRQLLPETMPYFLEAARSLEKAHSYSPSRALYPKALSELYSRLGRWAEAMELLGAPLPPAAPAKQEAFEKALSYLQKAVTLEPSNADIHLALGHHYDTVLKDPTRAEEEYLKAVAAFPVSVGVRYSVATRHLQNGRRGDALEQARMIASLDESYILEDSPEKTNIIQRRENWYLQRLYSSYLFRALDIAWGITNDPKVISGITPATPDAREVLKAFMEWKGIEEKE